MTSEIAVRAGWSAAYAAFAESEWQRDGGDVLPPRIGRIASEHRGGFTVMTPEDDRLAQAPASLRRRLEAAGEDKPTVGDWVGYEPVPDGSLILRAVLPRRSRLRRKRPGLDRAQVLVANVDRVLIVTSVGRDLNARRLERYLSLVLDGGAEPVVVVSKADLADEDRRRAVVSAVQPLGEVRVVMTSKVTGEGIDAVRDLAPAGVTVAMLGSSGVGKSSLANILLGDESLAVGALTLEGKGRHTTTRRELVCLPSGGVLIDTPGMRELGLWAAESGVDEAFADVAAAAASCRFADCRHTNEPGCAVHAALADGSLTAERVDSYLKLQAELAENADPVAAAQDARQRGRVGARALRSRLRDKGRR
ncbi:MAG: ribosome small subunit-dependent GTPase A [Polyangiaceae bacterium]